MNKFIRIAAAGLLGHITGTLVGGVAAIGVDVAASYVTDNPDKRNKAATVGGIIGYWVAGVKTAVDIYKDLE